VIGIDLGLTNLAVVSVPVPPVSDGAGVVVNPQRLEIEQAKLRRLQRQTARRRGPDKVGRTAPSKRWLKSKRKVDRVHAGIANARSDTLHKLTTAVVRSAGTIVIEDLNVAGMIRNRSLARRIAGASWGEARRQLTYKAAWNGVELVVADRFFASTKTCSACGAVKAKLPLKVRTYRCGQCGLVLDRDVNACRNLAALATVSVTSSPSCGATINEPAGNSGKTDLVGNGYGHGKSQTDNVA
jgi:putative transposase